MRALVSEARKVIFLHAVKAAKIEKRKSYEECTDYQKGIFSGVVIGIILIRKPFGGHPVATETEKEIRKTYFPLWLNGSVKLS